jgi:hypothetical protein
MTTTRLPPPTTTAFLCPRTNRRTSFHLLLASRRPCLQVFASVLTCATLTVLLRLHLLHQSMCRRLVRRRELLSQLLASPRLHFCQQERDM